MEGSPSEHPAVARSLNGLALVHRWRGELAEVEALYRQSLAIWEKAFGPEHPDVAAAGLSSRHPEWGQGRSCRRNHSATRRSRSSTWRGSVKPCPSRG